MYRIHLGSEGYSSYFVAYSAGSSVQLVSWVVENIFSRTWKPFWVHEFMFVVFFLWIKYSGMRSTRRKIICRKQIGSVLGKRDHPKFQIEQQQAQPRIIFPGSPIKSASLAKENISAWKLFLELNGIYCINQYTNQVVRPYYECLQMYCWWQPHCWIN